MNTRINIITITRCKICGSTNIIKFGKSKNIQRWWCKGCRHKFLSNNALPSMKTPVNWQSMALTMYYSGIPFNTIQQKFQQENVYVSISTIYNWITKFSKRGLEEVQRQHPVVGDIWYILETVININGKKYVLIDLIDTETRFILASQTIYSIDTPDIEHLLQSAQDKACKIPQEIIINERTRRYRDRIGQFFNAAGTSVRVKLQDDAKTFDTVKHLRDVLQARVKVMKWKMDRKNAQAVLTGWVIFHNYFIPQEGLDNRTPAEKSKIRWTSPW